jgi:hypothetical protein
MGGRAARTGTHYYVFSTGSTPMALAKYMKTIEIKVEENCGEIVY